MKPNSRPLLTIDTYKRTRANVLYVSLIDQNDRLKTKANPQPDLNLGQLVGNE